MRIVRRIFSRIEYLTDSRTQRALMSVGRCLTVGLIAFGTLYGSNGRNLYAQGPDARPDVASEQIEKPADKIYDPSDTLQLIEKLSNPSYYEREAAQAELVATIKDAFPIIVEQLKTVDGETRHRLTSILMDVLEGAYGETHKGKATSVLKSLMEHRSGAAVLEFTNLYNNLRDRLGEKAYLRILQLTANYRQSFSSRSGLISVQHPLYISSGFQGNKEDLADLDLIDWIHFARLEGPNITREILEATLRLPGLKHLQLIETNLTDDDLKLLEKGPLLQHLEIVYSPIADELIDILPNVPVTDSLFIFGTKLSRQGMSELPKRISDVEIFISRGAHLGIICDSNSLVIQQVLRGSAADKARLRPLDKINSVNGKELTNFQDLLRELSQFAPEEKVNIKFTRLSRTPVPVDDLDDDSPNFGFDALGFKEQELEAEVTLGRRAE